MNRGKSEEDPLFLRDLPGEMSSSETIRQDSSLEIALCMRMTGTVKKSSDGGEKELNSYAMSLYKLSIPYRS